MRRAILDYIVACQRERNFPPTIREIAAHVGLAGPATVKNHIDVLVSAGYIVKNPKQPRAITVQWDPSPSLVGATRDIPFLGAVAAGTGVLAEETDHEMMSLPEEFTGRGDSFALRVRGDSMIDAGILSGDVVVVERRDDLHSGDIVIAGIPGDEATVKRYFPQGSRIVLKPENSSMEPMEFDAQDVQLYGKVISVLRRY
jgi:repressor LexA